MENNRRTFLKSMSVAALFPFFSSLNDPLYALPSMRKGKQSNIPLWRGFNLCEKFNAQYQQPFFEKDFKLMAEWGFNFARLPLSYWCWSSEDDWFKMNEKVLNEIDQAVEWGKKYKIHVNINFHRAPGFCINPPKPSTDLFEDDAPLEACCYHWKHFAERYKGYNNKEVSFNLLNEAPQIADEKYERVVRRLIETIRGVDKQRLIFVDGIDVGQRPLMSITDIPNIVQSGRGYVPMLISHYAASWVYGNKEMYYPKENLSWPLDENGKIIDKQYLEEMYQKKWGDWVAQGGHLHIGEFGAHNQTPHTVVLAWLIDLLSIYKEHHWGWSLWNLKGSFGVLDSARKDVVYEECMGYKLDRKMLDVLRNG